MLTKYNASSLIVLPGRASADSRGHSGDQNCAGTAVGTAENRAEKLLLVQRLIAYARFRPWHHLAGWLLTILLAQPAGLLAHQNGSFRTQFLEILYHRAGRFRQPEACSSADF